MDDPPGKSSAFHWNKYRPEKAINVQQGPAPSLRATQGGVDANAK